MTYFALAFLWALTVLAVGFVALLIAFAMITAGGYR